MSDTSHDTEFHALHNQRTPLLLLVNAWDAGSALLMQRLGAPAVATSSAAMAWANGYADGSQLPIATLQAALQSIARVLRVPLTVDIEGGYADDPREVGRNVEAVIDAGAVGINIEDGHDSPELLCHKIEQARAAAERRGVRLFINARTDVYLKSLAAPAQQVDETLRRARLYTEAGADGLFAPGAKDPAQIQALTAGTHLPVNLLALPGLPPARELAELGVRRVSSGSGIAESVYGRISELVTGFLQTGNGQALAAQALPYGELNALMKAAVAASPSSR